MGSQRQCLLYAILCAGMGFLWQFATVERNYGGNWSGLFSFGDRASLPNTPEYEKLYRRPNSPGFDGGYYYLMAVDPWMQGEAAKYVEWPGLRYRRLL
ncbi:MAG: hypothetical protein ACRD96_16655, partial [Bryobacteraceae bacterium]